MSARDLEAAADDALAAFLEQYGDAAETAIREAGYVSEDDRDEDVMTAQQEVERDTSENIGYELREGLRWLLAAAEFDRLAEVVSSTDVLLHGPVVAALREALGIVDDVLGVYVDGQRVQVSR